MMSKEKLKKKLHKLILKRKQEAKRILEGCGKVRFYLSIDQEVQILCNILYH